MSPETPATPWYRRTKPRARIRKMSGTMQRMLRAFRLVLAGQRKSASLLFGLVLLTAAMNVAQIWLIRTVVAALANGNDQRALVAGSISALGIAFLAIIKPWQDLLGARIQDRCTATIDTTLIKTASKWQDLNPFLRPDFQDTQQIIHDTSFRLAIAILQIGYQAPHALGAIGILISLGSLHPLIPITLIFGGILHYVMGNRQWDIAWESMFYVARQGSEANHVKAVAIISATGAEVRMLNMGPWLRQRFNRLSQEMLKEMTPRRLRGGAWAIGGFAIQGLVIAACLIYVARRADNGTLPVADLAFMISGLLAAQNHGGGIYGLFMELHTFNRGSEKLFEFIDTAGPEVAVPAPGTGKEVAAKPERGLTLRDVAFAYPNSERLILESVSLDMPMGSVTALVGENGAGKSTLVNLLTRMLDPTAGTITLDGIPYPEYDLLSLRNRITVVYQDAARFAMTLEDNIAVTDPAFSWTNPEPERAQARELGNRVGVGDVASTIPHGYQTELTRRYDESVQLSGGHWQLVTFARGLIRDDAALAILDEPSSALDPIRERDQIRHIQEFARAQRRSVLLISHRLSSVRWADQIVVLNQGRIRETGSHDDLLRQGGTYAELFRMQASRYRDSLEAQ